jgi:hypothetical protein
MIISLDAVTSLHLRTTEDLATLKISEKGLKIRNTAQFLQASEKI